ncbi:hypothetical protein GmHk_02G006233 [Glycine max]|nr:hypothetical protein GmHk_02G006233 [Glycine max]
MSHHGILSPTTTVVSPFMATKIPLDSAFATTFTNVPRTNTFVCATFFAGKQYSCPLLGLFGNQCATLLSVLHQRPFKNATPSTWAANSTHRHSDPTQRQEKLTHTMRDASLVSVTLESPPST